MTEVCISRLRAGTAIPTYAHEYDAGADLVAAESARLTPGERALIPTGIAIALPAGFVGLIHPRSGLAARYGLTIVNAPGTIDAGYRGEIAVPLINHDPAASVDVDIGDRIAQLVIQRVEHARFIEVDALDSAERGEGGFGSTGGHANLSEPF